MFYAKGLRVPLSVVLYEYLSSREWGLDCYSIDGGFDADGYTRVRVDGKSLKAHKLALEFKLGRVLEKHEVTRHQCHNRKCCNPNHLEVGSVSDNALDMVKAKRQLKGDRHPKRVYTEAQALEVIQLLKSGLKVMQVVKQTGYSKNFLFDIVGRKSWVHLWDGVLPEHELKGNSKYTEEKKQEALALLKLGFSQSQAAKQLGLKQTTISTWYKKSIPSIA